MTPTQSLRISSRVSLLRPTAVNSILAEVRAVQAQGRNLVSLMRGEPDFSTPAHIVGAGISALRSGRTMYPDNRGELKLREAVAEKLRRDNQLSYDPESEILVTDGATMGIYAALMAVLDPGDEVLLPDPVYDAYQSPIRLAGARPVSVRSSITGTRFSLDLQELETAVNSNTRALLLNTPWNPVGTVFTSRELEHIADFITRHDLILISDEIYEFITYDEHRHVSPATVGELKRRCIVVNSLSKTYAMPGWRVGYCAAPAHVIQSMLLVLQQSSRGPATFIQDAAAFALQGSQDCVEQMRTQYAERRNTVLNALSGLSKVQILPPEGGFFVMVDIRSTGKTSDEVRRHLLHAHDVVVIHGAAYGERGEGTLRVSFASGGDNLTEGLRRLRAGLETL